MAYFFDEWQALGASPRILAYVSGFKIEFSSSPQLSSHLQACDSRRGIGPSKLKLLSGEIDALLAKKAIERAPPSPGFYARLFLRPKKGGKVRPVYNMKVLNTQVVARTFKMATINTVSTSLRPDD